jgi:translation initiation factor IF-1
MKNIKVLLQHASGKTRFGFIAFQSGDIVRVRWNENSSEGVDINLTTEKSPLGAWKMIG